jgi:hypothetical protein
MKNAKFWLIQVAMLAIVGLVFGSPVIAESGQGIAMKNEHAENQDKANDNAGFNVYEPEPIVCDEGYTLNDEGACVEDVVECIPVTPVWGSPCSSICQLDNADPPQGFPFCA